MNTMRLGVLREELAQHGRRLFCLRHPEPVLVREDDDLDEDGGAEFQTGVWDGNMVDLEQAIADGPSSYVGDQVYSVCEREGAPSPTESVSAVCAPWT